MASPAPAPKTPADPNETSAKPAPPAETDRQPAPTFDVVRVERGGDAVLAGKGAPDSDVALMSSGQVVGQTRTDAAGNFVLIPPTLKPGDQALSLRTSKAGGPARDSEQSVIVSVPKTPRGQVVVAVAEPGKAIKLLSPPPGEAPAAVDPSPRRNVGAAPTPTRAVKSPSGEPPVTKAAVPALSIRSAELENGDGLYVSGAAPPGTSVRLYLNDSRVADVTAGPDGAWTVRVRRGLTGGHYAVRADAIAGGKVLARVAVPFDVPPAMAEGRPEVARSDAVPSVVVPPATPRAAERGAGAATAQARSAEAPPAAIVPGEAARPETRAVSGSEPAPSMLEPSESMTASAPHAADAAPTIEAKAPTAPQSDVVVDRLITQNVVRGDNLWTISRTRLGEGQRYTQIYAANLSQIRNPDLIYPGQVFVMPQ